eukprot:8795299-Pyramimonas_sp.AAC.1
MVIGAQPSATQGWRARSPREGACLDCAGGAAARGGVRWPRLVVVSRLRAARHVCSAHVAPGSERRNCRATAERVLPERDVMFARARKCGRAKVV